MYEYISLFAIGIVCIVIGISNRKGNISALHSYHRKRVTEENRLPFGKLVGLGMIIIGLSVILSGVASIIAEISGNSFFTIIGTVVITAGLMAGLGVSFFAMIKYNKGIF